MKKKIKKIYYKKLVRDKIPQRIKEAGGRYAVKLLKDGDFQKELLRKVEEEAGGLANAKTRGEVVSELGDTLDVVYEIKRKFFLFGPKIQVTKQTKEKENKNEGRNIQPLLGHARRRRAVLDLFCKSIGRFRLR